MKRRRSMYLPAFIRLAADGSRSPLPVATSGPTSIDIPANSSAPAKLTARIVDPQLWSPEHPHLYVADVTVSYADLPLDESDTKFGIRTIEFTPNEGFV